MANVADDEQSIQALITRAKTNTDRTGSLRRGTFLQLLELTHSPKQQLKILAAKNIRHFFNDFPDLEEDAINAVYDLCEDFNVEVRLEGYSALTQISKESGHLVKRNADVLVQLLQSDEPQEVAAVRRALLQHLDIDARATLGVLCDQLGPPDESMDAAEKGLRERLRALILAFITGDAKRAIVERYATAGSETERFLVESLLEAIEKFNLKDTEIITEDLLLSLGSFKQPSTFGSSLLKHILDKAVIALRNQKQPGQITSPVLPVLDLASFVVMKKQAASAFQLLQFYRRHLCNKFVMQKFNRDDQKSIVCHIAEAFEAVPKAGSPGDNNIGPLKLQVVDCSSFLLEPLGISSMSRTRHVNACTILLQACKERKDTTDWTPPDSLLSVMKTISDTLEAEKAKLPKIQHLIRSLAAASRAPGSSSDQRKNTGTASSAAPSPSSLQVPRATVPKRPSSAMGPERPLSAGLQSQPMGARSGRHTVIPTEPASERPPKRARSDIGIGPSLLDRLGNASSNPSNRANQARSTAPAQQPSDNSVGPPNGGFSIKGAATKQDQRSSNRDVDRRPSQTSLLDRMKDSGDIGGNRLFAEFISGSKGRRI